MNCKLQIYIIHVRYTKWDRVRALVPLLGPMGGGLGAALGFSPSAVVVAAGGGGAPSSEARTTSLPDLELLPRGKNNTLLEEELAVKDPMLEFIRKLEAAAAMFKEAIRTWSSCATNSQGNPFIPQSYIFLKKVSEADEIFFFRGAEF